MSGRGRLLYSATLQRRDAREARNMRLEFSKYVRGIATENSDFGAVELIFGELVANAIEHGVAPIAIRLFRAGCRAVLVISDRGRGLSADLGRSKPPVESLRGRGLFLVRRLARDLRFASTSGVEVDLPIELRA